MKRVNRPIVKQGALTIRFSSRHAQEQYFDNGGGGGKLLNQKPIHCVGDLLSLLENSVIPLLVNIQCNPRGANCI